MNRDEFQEIGMVLWKHNIKNGFTLEAPRQIGKSMLCLLIAKKYANKKTGFIIYSNKVSSAKLLHDKNTKLGFPDKHTAFISAHVTTEKTKIINYFNKTYDVVYHIYDEVDLEHSNITQKDIPNTLKIFTDIYSSRFQYKV